MLLFNIVLMFRAFLIALLLVASCRALNQQVQFKQQQKVIGRFQTTAERIGDGGYYETCEKVMEGRRVVKYSRKPWKLVQFSSTERWTDYVPELDSACNSILHFGSPAKAVTGLIPKDDLHAIMAIFKVVPFSDKSTAQAMLACALHGAAQTFNALTLKYKNLLSDDNLSEFLNMAARKGQTQFLKSVFHRTGTTIKASLRISIPPNMALTVLQTAAENQQAETVRYLLLDLFKRNKNAGEIVANVGMELKNPDLVELIMYDQPLSRNDQILAFAMTGDLKSLIQFAEQQRIDLAYVFVDPFNPLNTQSVGGEALCAASFTGQAHVVEYLIQIGVPAKFQHDRALIEATNPKGRGNADVVALLLQNGISPESGNGQPLINSVIRNDVRTVKLLVSLGADTNDVPKMLSKKLENMLHSRIPDSGVQPTAPNRNVEGAVNIQNIFGTQARQNMAPVEVLGVINPRSAPGGITLKKGKQTLAPWASQLNDDAEESKSTTRPLQEPYDFADELIPDEYPKVVENTGGFPHIRYDNENFMGAEAKEVQPKKAVKKSVRFE